MPAIQTWKGGPPPPVDQDGWGGEPGKQRRATLTGAYVLLGAIVMFFGALTSALVVRRGLGDDWTGIPVPGILWVSTAVILVSSIVLEMARRALIQGEREAFNRYWSIGSVLGLGFLGCQYTAWQQMVNAGVYINSTPGSSFFYLFTVAHAVHVLGGIVALAYIEVQALRLRLGPGKRTAVEFTRLYWHFLAGLWFYLILLFQFWG